MHSNPSSGKDFGGGGGDRVSGSSTDKKGPTDERPPLENFGVSYDPPLGNPREAHEGAGGKIDSSQRDMGRTGEVM